MSYVHYALLYDVNLCCSEASWLLPRGGRLPLQEWWSFHHDGGLENAELPVGTRPVPGEEERLERERGIAPLIFQGDRDYIFVLR